MKTIFITKVAAWLIVFGCAGFGCTGVAVFGVEKPNVLFIAMDDLNDWVGCLGGHPQTITPNLDRLAASGTLFTNAHCAAPACNPSRTAIFTGRAPNRSGLYDNRQQMREVLPDAVLLPRYFHDQGYYAAGSGKLLHYFIEAKSWDDYFPARETENPLPDSFDPPNRPVSLPRGGPWQYVETDWAALDVTDEQFGGDFLVSQWIGEQLQQPPKQPLFLACGIYRPHEPWFVPKKYFEPFPLESIQLPPGYLENDLDDVPESGVRFARNRYFAHIQQEHQWKQGVQAYLASIHFADAMLGRVLDALDRSPLADNTIVVLWSDHGWQLGEKEHWQKYTGWREVTRVPLIIRVPAKVSASLPAGTQTGSVCEQPVNLLSLYPTLLELCGLPAKADNDGPSLLPLLREPESTSASVWPHVSVTFLQEPNSYSVSQRAFRYIHYADGGEELYDIKHDPYEWKNLANDGAFAEQLKTSRAAAPVDFAEKVAASVQSLIALQWIPADTNPVPPSHIVGGPFDVHFINESVATVELFSVDEEGNAQSCGLVEPEQTRTQSTGPGAVWIIQDTKTGQRLGHFVVDDRTAKAIVPGDAR